MPCSLCLVINSESRVGGCMAPIEVGSPARSAGLRQGPLTVSDADRHRDRGGRHDRRRRLHQPRIPGSGDPVRLLAAAAVGGRRLRRAVRGIFLRRARRHVSPLQRRVQLSAAGLSPGRRLHGGLAVGDGRICGPGVAGRDGVRRIRQGHPSGRPAAGARPRSRLDRLPRRGARASSTAAGSRWSGPS